MAKYSWLYEVTTKPSGHTTQFDNYRDFAEFIEYYKDRGYVVQVIHATKNNPITYAVIF